MSLGSDILATLPFLQEQAQSMMTDVCEIGTVSAEPVFDENTGTYLPGFTLVYEGPCRFKSGATQSAEIDAQGQLLVEQDSILNLPMGADDRIVFGASKDVLKNMVVRVTTSVTDEGLPGTEARIKGPAVGSYRTARRFAVEVTS